VIKDSSLDPAYRMAPMCHRLDVAKPMAPNYLRICYICSHYMHIEVERAVLLPFCCQIRVIDSPPLRPPEFLMRRRMIQFRSGAGSIDLMYRRAVMSLPSSATADSAFLSPCRSGCKPAEPHCQKRAATEPAIPVAPILARGCRAVRARRSHDAIDERGSQPKEQD
jgi:hypothetical protein